MVAVILAFVLFCRPAWGWGACRQQLQLLLDLAKMTMSSTGQVQANSAIQHVPRSNLTVTVSMMMAHLERDYGVLWATERFGQCCCCAVLAFVMGARQDQLQYSLNTFGTLSRCRGEASLA